MSERFLLGFNVGWQLVGFSGNIGFFLVVVVVDDDDCFLLGFVGFAVQGVIDSLCISIR